MPDSKFYDIAIIGGGIVGTATALALVQENSLSVVVIEAEKKLAAHQTGNNSGVIHSGLYYKPGSLKAVNCTEGRELMYSFCKEYNIKHERCGKVVVAVNESEIAALDELERRGSANGLKGLRRLDDKEIKDIEPHAAGIAGLHVPQTGIVDYIEVTNTFGRLVTDKGGEIRTGTRFISLSRNNNELLLNTTAGTIRCGFLVNCGGLYSDRIAKTCGVVPNLQIIPFRGEYYKLKEEKKYLVNNLIYPVPDPQYPFLGVHFTRMVKGGVEAGPNAVLAFKREGYKHSDISIKDISSMVSFGGFWKMAMKHYKMGFNEFYRSLSRKAFVNALKKLIPEIEDCDIQPGGAGVRAQALEPDGKLVDDFRIVTAERMIHVLNAPSPAATASISIGRKIAELTFTELKSV